MALLFSVNNYNAKIKKICVTEPDDKMIDEAEIHLPNYYDIA